MYRIQHKIQLYWVCEQCKTPHPWPQERARKYCDRKCKDAAYYSRKVKDNHATKKVHR